MVFPSGLCVFSTIVFRVVRTINSATLSTLATLSTMTISRRSSKQSDQLNLETLEKRKMLSTVDVFVAGATNEETINLNIDGETVQTWEHIGGDASSGDFVQLTCYTNGVVRPDQVQIEFVNDLYAPNDGIDRNVRVDKIRIDGVVYESESPDVFSTGTWVDGLGVTPGNHESEYLHTNGYLQFGGAGSGSVIEVEARGATGEEQFTLEVDGEELAYWYAGTGFETFTIHSDRVVTPDQVRITFVNDYYDPESGFDRNLQVDRIAVDGVTVETESDVVFSTGTWKAEDGVTPGFRNSEYLNANGYFQYGTPSGDESLANVEPRTDFGVDNDIEDLLDPALGTPLRRVTTASYPGDGSGNEWNAPEPSTNPATPPNTPENTGTAVQPLKITDNIYAPGSDVDRPNSGGLNEFSQFFAQFVTHDMVHSVRAAGPPIFLDGQFIPVSRTPAIEVDGVLQQVSSDTPSLDLGLVYGKDELATETLREIVDVDGKQVAGAKLISGGAGDVLPSYSEVADHRGQSVEEIQEVLGTTFLDLPPDSLANQAATGDERANQTTSLTAHHTIWFRNHNWHVDQLRVDNPDWSEEQLYQAARALNEAEYQKVIYDEYLPLLIGDGALSEYSGYQADVDPSIINEWTTVAFRFGHDQASDGQILISETGEVTFIPLSVSSLIANNGDAINTDEELGDWLRGQLAQSSQEIDGRIVPTLREALFGVPESADDPEGSDDEFLQLNLPLLDIHRGRDHGVSDYNHLRAGLGLKTYDSLEDYAKENGLDQERLDQLKSVYSDISELDSIVGGLLEAKVPGSQLGETFTILNVMQFEATRDGDPFFYKNRFAESPEVLGQIEQSSMSQIMERVGAVDEAQSNAFLAQPTGSVITLTARGDTGDEVMSLEVNGERVKSWKVDQEFATFTYWASDTVYPVDVRIVYENDLYDPEIGVDRNLQVDKIDVGGIVVEIESDYVYSTGTWLPEDGVTPGYRFSEYLNADGYFDFGFGLDFEDWH